MYDYVPGKTDWLAAGLPREGKDASTPLASDAAGEVPTCHYREGLAALYDRLKGGAAVVCVAVNDEGIVMGLLKHEQLESGTDVTVEEVMKPAPTTVRASEPLADLAERMRRARVEEILVTTPEGRLVGLLRLDQADAVLRGEAK